LHLFVERHRVSHSVSWRVDSVSTDGWHASLSFEKANGSNINSGTNYWIVVGPATPSCLDLGAYVVRKYGTVSSTGTVLSVANVPIWPDQSTYDGDAPGTRKAIFIVTDGSTTPNTKTWFQKDAMTFTKGCP